MPNHGDWQLGIYLAGLEGVRPDLPMDYAELARRAEEVMSPEMWSYVAGGAGDETTQNANVRAFARYGLMPRMLAGAAERDVSVELFGQTPPDAADVRAGRGDRAVRGRRARRPRDRPRGVRDRRTDDRVDAVAGPAGGRGGRARRHAGLVPALPAQRPRAHREPGPPRRGRRLPGDRGHARHPHPGLAAARPHARQLPAAQGPVPGQLLQRPGLPLQAGGAARGRPDGGDRAVGDDLRQPEPDLGRPGLAPLADALPILLKGICSPLDARRAVDAGMDGIYCSNHGGRQANGGLPALDCLAEVLGSANGLPVVFDSGVRSGPDVLKALAIGASAVAIGRPYAYGLAVGGQAGIEHVVRCLLAEMDLTMAIDGYPSLADLTREAVRPVPAG